MTPAQGKQGHLINPSFYRCCPTELFDSLKPLTIESHVAHLERLVADLVGQAIAEVENDPATAMRLDDLPTRMPKAVNVRQRNSC